MEVKKWVGNNEYKVKKRYRLKSQALNDIKKIKGIPKDYFSAIKVIFRFECVWIIYSSIYNEIVLDDNKTMKVAVVNSNKHGQLIGEKNVFDSLLQQKDESYNIFCLAQIERLIKKESK